jgi:cyanuric acid amidohydrolase
LGARRCRVDRLAMDHPGDAAGLQRLFDDGSLSPFSVAAIFGKTEGNGCVNDFSRPYAVMVVKALLAHRMGCSEAVVSERVPIVVSGGTEGGLSPHWLVFSVDETAAGPSATPSLAIGTAMTRAFLPEEIGRPPQIDATMAAVHRAMQRAGITEAAEVHYVQVKCPLLTAARMADARRRGQDVVTGDTYASMGFSRGASALGVALALGELSGAAVSADAVCRDFGHWSARAATSAGIELLHNEIVVLGNSAGWASDSAIAHAVMQDALDVGAVHATLQRLGLSSQGQLAPDDAARICAVLAKAEPSRSGTIRGRRHIMWDDSDINATRHARALLGGVLAGVLGCTDLFVSGGAEHQGPDGGGPIAIVARFI